MSADTRPISPGRFAAALKALSPAMLHLKVLEIRNSIAHLQYSNDQLEPFAKGTASAVDANPSEPDQDCIDAIKENEVVIDRMVERIALVRAEVEDRGMSWSEFRSKEEVEAAAADRPAQSVNGTNGQTHAAWTDGTFQTGTIRGGQVHFDEPAVAPNTDANSSRRQGGTLDDDELRRQMEERMRDLGDDDDEEEEEGGMHL